MPTTVNGTVPTCNSETRKIRYYSRHNFTKLPGTQGLSADELLAIKVVSSVLPFKVNNYVAEELIDWDRVPDDPMFRLTFPHGDMLEPRDFNTIADLVRSQAPPAQVKEAANRIRMRLNPHPAGQMEHNVPTLEGKPVCGLQHKYRETVLFFPTQGQTCHSYCTFCFRWAQFVGIQDIKFQSKEVDTLVRYLKAHPEVTDVLITGGDPMIMPSRFLRSYVEALLAPGLEHVRNIRIGTKSVSYWPYRYFADPDSDEVMRLFEKVVRSGKHLAVMGHYNHYREIETGPAREAVRRIRATGAEIRCQSPLVRHVNDSAEVWERMWKEQVRQGCIPYYMFVERDTGPKQYFELPLARAHDIFSRAYRKLPGLARTVRGPSMSATPGKVAIDGVAEVNGEKVFVLHFIQARNPEWVNRPFFARFDPEATWLDGLRPAFGRTRFFFEPELAEILDNEKATQQLVVA